MITEDLVVYIQGQIKKNISEDLILSRLLQAGWHEDDAKAGLVKATESIPKSAPKAVENVAPISSPIPLSIKSSNTLDPYRELPETDDLQDMLNKTSTDASINSLLPKRSEPQVWVPNLESKPVATEQIPQVIKEEPKIEKPVFTDLSNMQNVINQSSYKDTVVNLEQVKKVAEATPVKPIGERVIEKISSDSIKNESEPELSRYVVPEDDEDVETESPISNSTPVVNTTLAPSRPIEGSTIPINIIPEIKPAIKVAPIISDISRSIVNPSITKAPATLAQKAMLSSFAQASSSSQQSSESVLTTKKIKIPKILIIASVFIVVGGGTAFAFMKGYINLSKISFVKKDSKILIMNTPSLLSQMPSYKVDTSINITLPSFANITASLVSGQAQASTDKDSVSLSLNGLVNHGVSGFMYDYNAVFKSSIEKSEISTDLKYDGTHYFVNVPNLSDVLKTNTPSQATVSFSRGQTDLILPELSPTWRDRIGNSNLYKVLSGGIPEYARGIIASSFKEFILSANITEKDTESLKNVPTYHYIVNADRTSTKKLLSSIGGIFTSGTSEDYKRGLDEAFGAVNIDSLEVWIGKDDNIVHQVKVSLAVPLSKVIGLDDKGIGDNVVKIDWQTSYYDFNVANTIQMPQSVTSIEDFTKLIRDTKIKSKVSLFADSAQVLKNAEGSFGKKSNPSGSCTAPTSGSLFSPLGHTKGTSTAVGTIAGIMTDTLALTGNSGSCYSTTKDWAVAFPLASQPTTSFCVDSKGGSNVITTALTKISCE